MGVCVMWSVAAPRPAQMRRDPAPSRMEYRYQRMMLTPLIRRLVTRWLPVVAVIGIGAAIVMAPDNRARIQAHWTDLRHDIEMRPEFAVNALAIEGASPELAEQVRELMSMDFPVSRFQMDLEGLRDSLRDVPAIDTVRLTIGVGGILDVVITERQPVAVWRSPEGLSLVDAEGVQIGWLTQRFDRPDLPLVVGSGAAYAVGEAQELIAALGPLQPRFRGLLRRGERRWDVVLDRSQSIMLPADNPVPALERVVALAQASDFLDRDLVAVDMRVPQRPTLRMTEAATQTLRDARQAALEGQ